MLTLDYKINGKAHHLDVDLPYEDDALSLELLKPEGPTIHLLAKKPMTLIQAILDIDLPIRADKTLINGYQSWTDSPIFDGRDRVKPVPRSLDFFFRAYGDQSFAPLQNKAGRFNSFHHILVYGRDSDLDKTSDPKKNLTYGIKSLDESKAYTIFQMDLEGQSLKAYRDVEGKRLSQGETFLLYDLVHLKDDETKVLEGLFPPQASPAPKISGWTSWYNYYTKITEPILRDNLTQILESPLPLEVFQIDDGYQTKVGDWLSLKDSFGSSLAPLVTDIHKGGLKAGLWLAPFVAEKESDLYKNHPDWFISHRGKPQKAGWNPGWSGNFYTLDIYKEEVVTYLQEVFKTVKSTWGFDLVKLDFLYAIALRPYGGRTRGQIMRDGVKLLRDLCEDMTILGCGVPLGSARDLFDYCRIGSDVAPYWEDKLLKKVHYRERVSTVNSLKSTLGRSILNTHYFGNDPDVFIMRDTNCKMTSEQKKTLLTLNMVLGQLVFTSDCVGHYDDASLALISDFYPLKETKVLGLESSGDFYHLRLEIDGIPYDLLTNLGKSHVKVQVPMALTLKPYETKLIKK